MKHYANDSKWSSLYTSLNNQARENVKIIFSKIPYNVSEDEIKEVIQELRSLSNYKNYSISRNSTNIIGVKRYE